VSLALHVGRNTHELGTPSFFKAFFSTVSTRLEHGNWASRFPVVMKSLYAGEVPAEQCREALMELKTMREALRVFPASAIVWDFENLSAQPPWGANISASITSLENYFVTSSGRELLAVLEAAFTEALACGSPVTVS
jgi:2,3-bisphosphoglycerate-dependent phosphoglycerate mutase